MADPEEEDIGDYNDEDLFGSDSNDESAGAGSGTAPAAPGSKGDDNAVPSSQEKPPSQGSHHSQEKPASQASQEKAPSLAADDGEDEISEEELFGSEAESEPDEAELFGSEGEDGDDKAKPAEEGLPAPGTAVPSEISEMDERDIFGDVSDDEPEKEEDVCITRRPAPPTNREFVTLRLPNVLAVDLTSFRGKESIPQSMLEGYKEFNDTRLRPVLKLLAPENCVRWRFKKGADGEILTDETGRPQYQSNSRIVEWEDGSRTMYVGAESYDITDYPDKNLGVFEENSKDMYVCHGLVTKRFVATPRSMVSKTHDMLKSAQYRKYEPVRRSLLMTGDDRDESQRALEEGLRVEAEKQKERQKKASEDAGLPGMSVGFLEDDDAAIGPSLQDLKRQSRGGAGARPAKRAKSDKDSKSSPASGPSSAPASPAVSAGLGAGER
eukprot:TRINITY_DN75292_c0_g1_i1.p1 TRINITY_DN75292_c0_g1~~TRINITY_DN75292_c0_g1_i1.p1  ORF type:complete len:439 (-),score=97.01 TRINITY_DN75292_c0_g1_i1:131-1447(-)